MPKTRVLIIDDAVVIRKILTDVISSDPDLEVVGTASNGKIGLQKITQLNPDIITLDVEMPEMNGLEALKHIKKDFPKIPVIMFSTLTERGASATLEALGSGASDYVTKPANVGSVTDAKEAVKQDLVSKIKALTTQLRVKVDQKPLLPTPAPRPLQNLDKVSLAKVKSLDVIVIGVSTGGPNALATLIPQLPENLGVPVLIVQHMPPMFTRLLAERLNAQSKLKVVEATTGMQVVPGTVYIAPGNFHLEVVRTSQGVFTKLHQGPQENSCRPAVDVLFRSVGEVYGGNTLSIILTGMGQDGLRGCEILKEKGGIVLAQDKLSSVVWGMPSYVVEAGLADGVLPLPSVAPEIIRLTQIARSRMNVNGEK